MKDNSHKWEFGMYPISERMASRYDVAVQNLLEFLEKPYVLPDDLTTSISEVKGIFNRIARQDQLDWFSVSEKLGYPSKPEATFFAQKLKQINTYIKSNESGKLSIHPFTTLTLLRYLKNWIFGVDFSKSSFVYLLSKKDDPKKIKIGRTTQLISTRAKQINSASGIFEPYGARHAFKVKDSKVAEKAIHQLFAQQRIRNDREFFHMKYYEAVKQIQEFLVEGNLLLKNKGIIQEYDPKLKTGKLLADQMIILHFDQNSFLKSSIELKKHNLAEFDFNHFKGKVMHLSK